MTKKNRLLPYIEEKLEVSMFASRWFMAPVYIVLSITLFVIMVKVIQEFIHELSHFWHMNISELLLFVLHITDLALVGNLILMIIFAGYENFVSKIDVARTNYNFSFRHFDKKLFFFLN